MNKEWTIEQIRNFVKKDYQSVSARYVKCLLGYYDESQASDKDKEILTEQLEAAIQDYNDAKKEIERLKGLIEKAFNVGHTNGIINQNINKAWKEFQQNNL